LKPVKVHFRLPVQILQECLQAGVDRESQLLQAIASLCAAGTRQSEDIINTSKRLGYASAIVDQAQQGKQKRVAVKRQFEGTEDEANERAELGSSEAGSSAASTSEDEKKYEDIMKFVDSFKSTRKRMNWSACFDMV
ncbi:hypothetical protein BCR43DRAFT_490999, partial [Syncephalastrum racemosum]